MSRWGWLEQRYPWELACGEDRGRKKTGRSTGSEEASSHPDDDQDTRPDLDVDVKVDVDVDVDEVMLAIVAVAYPTQLVSR